MIYKRIVLFYLFCVNYFLMLAKSIQLFNILRRKIIKPTSLSCIANCTATLYNKKIITLSPGGFKGFYMLGICKYIKEHYDLTDYVFSGASAGAWNSLLLCFKGDIEEFQKHVLNIDYQTMNNLNTIEYIIKSKIMCKYTSDDFDLDKLFIGTTVFEKLQLKSIVYTGFENLDDAIDCCIASSHIPFVTGKFKYRYRGLASFDGGFSEYPYVNESISKLHISPSIWKTRKTVVEKLSAPNVQLSDFTTLFSNKDYNMKTLIQNGYNDAVSNREYLDEIFIETNKLK